VGPFSGFFSQQFLRMKNGITLVELLIAVSIFAFVIASSYLLLRQFSRTFSRGIIQSEMREKVRELVSTFSRDISSMYLRCEGNSKNFAFFSLRRRGEDFKVSEIRYRQEGDKLYREVQWDSDRDLSEQTEREVFIDDLKEANFSFYNGKWQNHCSVSQLPERVRLEIRWKGYSKKYELECEVMAR